MTWPKLARCVYRVAAMRNNSYVPLVAGDAEVFVDGASLGRLHLESADPGQSLTLNLGVDDRFMVQRPRIEVRSEPSREQPQRHRAIHEARTTIESRHSTRQVVEVRDELPRSADPAIVVEMVAPESLGATTTAGASEAERSVPVVTTDGSITWLLTFEPGQKWELPLKLVVTWPANQHVVPWILVVTRRFPLT